MPIGNLVTMPSTFRIDMMLVTARGTTEMSQFAIYQSAESKPSCSLAKAWPICAWSEPWLTETER